MQSHLHASSEPLLHVAIIMDGNGRWATRQGLPRPAGHRAGLEGLRKIVRAAPQMGIGTLTVYAFSADNWRRPPTEVAALMSLLHHYLRHEIDSLRKHGIRLSALGRRDRFTPRVRAALERMERETRAGDALHLRLALDYSARDAILAAVANLAGRPLDRDSLTAALAGDQAVPPLDLLIRSGGEQRLSDFLLWEAAYAELYFTPCLWPDFDAAELLKALAEFYRRDRRFGGLTPATGQLAAAG
jgi:undecaprenyl diphosphate synthase